MVTNKSALLELASLPCIPAMADALHEAIIEVICRTGRLPEHRYDIPADISLRLGRKWRQAAALRALAKEKGE